MHKVEGSNPGFADFLYGKDRAKFGLEHNLDFREWGGGGVERRHGWTECVGEDVHPLFRGVKSSNKK